jgi:hypothetical protein
VTITRGADQLGSYKKTVLISGKVIHDEEIPLITKLAAEKGFLRSTPILPPPTIPNIS